MVNRQPFVLHPDALGLAVMATDRIIDRQRETVMHQLRPRSKSPKGSGPDLVRGPLIDAGIRLENPPIVFLGTYFDPPDTLVNPHLIGDLPEIFLAS